ncbi:hypothetical protein QJQ45_004551 [Haematococcus lacustris]|nr:hypothetical protein QJQ45_004551 [Haematococcus lacustris]
MRTLGAHLSVISSIVVVAASLLPATEESSGAVWEDACTSYLLADLPAAGVTVFNISQSTCNRANGWNCRTAPDFLYLLPSSEEGDRSITLDTCVEGVAAWDTFLYVIPVQDGTCGQCSGVIAFNDDSSICGNGLSHPCTPYLLDNLPAAGVTVFNISQTTCNRANGWNCRPVRDFLYLLPSSEEGDRSITLDTCVEGVAAWDTFLYVIPVQDGTCGQCRGAIASDDESSICGSSLSRVTFPAVMGQAYWVLVEGYFASNVDPCIPYLLDNLPAAGVTVFNISQTTCDRDAAYNWDCQPSLDFLYLLPSSEEDNRSITLDTCVEGVAAWNTVLYVIPVQDGTCGQCSGVIAFNDDGSTCGGGRSRVTFNAAAGQAYWVLVDGSYDVGVAVLALQQPTSPHPTSQTAPNGWNCRPASDFLYLLPSSEEGDRSITLDTFVYEYDFWNTLLYGAIASDDDSSFWNNGLSRLTFTAKAGQAYWILVEGYSDSDCGNPALNVITGPVAPPSPPTPPPHPPPSTTVPDACNPYLLDNLPAAGVTVFTLLQSTCNEDNRWNCKAAPDFLYLLPSSKEGDRSITLDTCSEEMATWDSILYVIPTKDGTCGQCSGVIAANDDGSICGGGLSRVTFTAKAGQAYWVLVEGYSFFDTRASTCGRANGWNCRPAPDFLYLLPSSEEGDRSITLDTCVDGVAAWDTILYVIPTKDGTCGQCSGVIAINDNRSICGNGLSRVTFTARAGQAYWVLVEGYSASNVGAAVPALQQLTSPHPSSQTARAALPPCEAAALSAGLLGQAAWPPCGPLQLPLPLSRLSLSS